MRKKPALWLFTLFLYAGCSVEKSDLPGHVRSLDNLTVYPSDAVPEKPIELIREETFGGVKDSLWIENIAGVAIDDSGRVFIAEEAWGVRAVHAYQLDGSYRTTLGSYGEEKGEFFDIENMEIHGNRLIVFDGELQRGTIYSLDLLELIQTVDLTPVNREKFEKLQGSIPVPYSMRNDGTFLIRFIEQNRPQYDRQIRYHAMNSKREILPATLLVQKDVNYLIGDYAGRPAPFTLSLPERSLIAVSDDGHLFSAWTEEFLIKMYDANGDYLRAYYYPFIRTPLHSEDVIHPRYSHNTQLLRVRESAEYPKSWPALYSMLVDDEERLWVSAIIDDPEVFEWWVLDTSAHPGEVLARFTWPRNESFEAVKNGSLYVSTMSPENGFKHVVRYRIEGL